MRVRSLVTPLLFSTLFSIASAQTPSYFMITSPALNDTWTAKGLNVVKWVVGVDQGINAFDIELLRLSTDGILPIARQVPTTWSALNIDLEGVPTGDDYFAVFLNYDSSTVYSVSPRFQIKDNAGSTSNAAAGPTVTVSGSPGPTKAFAQTFAPSMARMTRQPLPWLGVTLSLLIAFLFGFEVVH
ncbi:uncharacterized protein EI90DRAFT_3055631 [Cantharellus anzutake]|uniref:uncharacterized protein n=1 Tax=Cantharellus anzutake TaxID=1750568 RepID=UPI00190839C8|nr:uncharacterized protein EI90DRAFT_3055631 [Cantharellus anzutake]KAF8331852.1 hypothetical protein EI90DRAFT_3055631 [Cantharellus anzutake]